MQKKYSLVPFAAPDTYIKSINGAIGLVDDCLAISYVVTGDIESVLMPRLQAAPVRRDKLWKGTCFECFVKGMDSEEYYEINLSPNGDWNAYYFQGYRLGMAEEPAIGRVDSKVLVGPDMAVVECCVPIVGCRMAGASLRLGLSCVLLHSSGAQSYWALAHPASRPDFHDLRSFCLEL